MRVGRDGVCVSCDLRGRAIRKRRGVSRREKSGGRGDGEREREPYPGNPNFYSSCEVPPVLLCSTYYGERGYSDQTAPVFQKRIKYL